jgi:3-oxoacyl-[acyl-carrier protein] reductase
MPVERLDGQIALVTGGSRGIGRGIALELAREGADVAVNYRRRGDAAEETVAAIRALGRRAVAIEADVTDAAAVDRLVERTVGELGGIDIAVANSGVASRVFAVADMPLEEWHRVVATNLHGVFYTCRAAIPHLVTRRGLLLLVSSVGADLCGPFGAPYHAAKAGVNALTKVMAKELAPSGVRVNAIAPGVVRTEMGDRLMAFYGGEIMKTIPLGRPGEPAEIGRLAAYLASPDATWITGQIFRIDGGSWM